MNRLSFPPLKDILALIRFNRPIGSYLVLWPTLCALWLAAGGVPDMKLLLIFIAGTFLMRSAGCAINDYADRHIDGHVKRTASRPMAAGAITEKQALAVFAVLCLVAFSLVLLTNALTVWLSFGAVALAACYPFMKRHTHLPQLVLGAAFAWSIPMAFAAQTNLLPQGLWLLYIATVLWVLVYDTFYAMVDRDDDLKIGVKSTAILFGEDDRVITGILQVCVIFVMLLTGNQFSMGYWYFVGLIAASALFGYQQYLIRHRERDACFKAFLNNNWVGVCFFVGTAVDFAVRSAQA